MVEVIKSDVFDKWLRGLKDRAARTRIIVRIDRLANGNPGDVKSVGEGVSEMRIDYGPGYRVYFVQKAAVLAILLCGGDKGSQAKDIKAAKTIAASWKD